MSPIFKCKLLFPPTQKLLAHRLNLLQLRKNVKEIQVLTYLNFISFTTSKGLFLNYQQISCLTLLTQIYTILPQILFILHSTFTQHIWTRFIGLKLAYCFQNVLKQEFFKFQVLLCTVLVDYAYLVESQRSKERQNRLYSCVSWLVVGEKSEYIKCIDEHFQ
ncbi:Hypothetical_protein [Hexamita inflata]|uniref:Hypothetical_protein n=1 Tax=Hexamita inflata TaxID=28002 RepID=A0AA86NIS0_9EUKA|nr:Hypothetical protein HINF_LOCUS8427 [Hexamita inflata]